MQKIGTEKIELVLVRMHKQAETGRLDNTDKLVGLELVSIL